jgi:hypothetical protein
MKKPAARKNLLKAFKIVGKAKLSAGMGVRYQSVDRWVLTNRLPLTEYAGDTQYSMAIEKMTNGAVTVADLLGFVPITQTPEWDGWQ